MKARREWDSPLMCSVKTRWVVEAGALRPEKDGLGRAGARLVVSPLVLVPTGTEGGPV